MTDLPSQRPPFDRRTEDIGNIVEFGHINLRVPDQSLAIVFYVMGLGLTRDPFLNVGVDNAWINVGTSQFHLPIGAAQVWRGRVDLVMADVDALCIRLENIRSRLSGTCFAFARDGASVDISCPWGNRLRVHAPDANRHGRLLLGMPRIQVDTLPGRVEGIARFYRDILGARAYVSEDSGARVAVVSAGLDEALVFRETRDVLAPYDGHHLQITVADFSGVHRRLLDRGLITEESDASQYRFQDIVDIDSGEVLGTLEHEVRSMRHPMYARPLVNRDPLVTARDYAGGRETAIWRMA